MEYKIKKLKIIAYGCLVAGSISTFLLKDLFYLGLCLGFLYFNALAKEIKKKLEKNEYEKIAARVLKIHDDKLPQKTMNRFFNKVRIDFRTENESILSFKVLRKDILKNLVHEPDLMEGMLCYIYLEKETGKFMSDQSRLVAIVPVNSGLD